LNAIFAIRSSRTHSEFGQTTRDEYVHHATKDVKIAEFIIFNKTKRYTHAVNLLPPDNLSRSFLVICNRLKVYQLKEIKNVIGGQYVLKICKLDHACPSESVMKRAMIHHTCRHVS
jgi:hypothetical protein